jgi:exodeoxyribonuclease-3
VRLAPWNVNSARARHFRFVDWLDRAAPDVACLQETKMGDDEFDALYADDLFRRGYAVAHFGQGRWNGVALISRVGLDDVVTGLPDAAGPLAGEARAIGAICGDMRVWSLYVPNGRSLDDPMYAAKLTWLGGLRQVLAEELAGGHPVVVAGDFNIAPADVDVWDPAAFVGSTHVTAEERQILGQLESDGLYDLVRSRWPNEVAYSYWDYRAGMFHKNFGMRIDLVLGTAALRDRLAAAYVDRQARKGKDPSDHAPVIVDLDVAPDGDIGPLVPPPSAQPGGRPSRSRSPSA